MKKFPAPASVLDKVMLSLGIAVPVGIALGIFLLKGIFYDERLNMHFLQMTLTGLRPHHDFFCPYPVSFYVLFWPLRALIIDRPISILLLRAVSITCLFLIGMSTIYVAGKLRRNVMIAAVAFMAAVNSVNVLSIFSEARSDGLASLLALLSMAGAYTSTKISNNLLIGFAAGVSILINPKYIVILGLIFIAVCVSDYFSRPAKVWLGALYLAAGIGAAFGFGQLLCRFAGTNLLADIRQSAILNMRFQQYVHGTGNSPQQISPQEMLLFPYAIQYPHAVILWGYSALLCVLQCFRKKWDRTQIVSLAALLGASLSWVMAVFPFRQYLVPGVVASIIPMALGASHIYEGLRKSLRIAFSLFLVICSIVTIILTIHRTGGSVAWQFFVGRGCLDRNLAIETELTEIIPSDERVLSAAFPWTRRNVSYLVFDEIWGDPPGFERAWRQVYTDKEQGNIFSAEHISSRLADKRPALISVFPENVPDGWRDEIVKYIESNKKSYTSFEIGRTIVIRKDLIRREPSFLKLR
ncbi:MAG: hypothetical protein RAO92_00010 [Candidatus Euphemobacter frigidus]|nr:hypothetical protein [Candidatus Euphemobacter frigidus]MDP8274761.1 hypothetical protein [Candidatus Euphemobacter frigidus]